MGGCKNLTLTLTNNTLQERHTQLSYSRMIELSLPAITRQVLAIPIKTPTTKDAVTRSDNSTTEVVQGKNFPTLKTKFSCLKASRHNDSLPTRLPSIQYGGPCLWHQVRDYILTQRLSYQERGEMYSAIHIITGIQVTLHSFTLSERELVLRILSIYSRVYHPNILRLYEILTAGKRIWVVMDAASRGNLATHRSSYPSGILPESSVRQVIRQLISAVEYLHGRGFAHGRIGFDTVLMQADLQMKLSGLENCQSVPVSSHPSKAADISAVGRLIISLLTGENFTDSSAIPSEDAYKNLSKDCQDLVRRILGTSRGSQFTLPEFIHHPWMNKSSSKSLARHIQEAKPMIGNLNSSIVKHMVTFGGYSEDQICESVLSQRADPIYALYEFLSHRWKAGLYLPKVLVTTDEQVNKLQQRLRRKAGEYNSKSLEDETAVDYRLPKLTNQVAESQADYKAMLEMLHKKPKSKSRVITISSDKLPVTSERGKHLTTLLNRGYPPSRGSRPGMAEKERLALYRAKILMRQRRKSPPRPIPPPNSGYRRAPPIPDIVMEAPVDVDYQDDIPECYRELSGRAKSDQGKHELSPLSPLSSRSIDIAGSDIPGSDIESGTPSERSSDNSRSCAPITHHKLPELNDTHEQEIQKLRGSLYTRSTWNKKLYAMKCQGNMHLRTDLTKIIAQWKRPV